MATDEKSKKSTGSLQIPNVMNPDNVRSIYANNVGIGATMTDVQMVFTHVDSGKQRAWGIAI